MDNTNQNNIDRDLDRILNESTDSIFENTEKVSRSVSSDPTIEKARSEISAQTDSMLREIEERRQRRLARQRELNQQIQAEQEAKARRMARTKASETAKSANMSNKGAASDVLSSDKIFVDSPKRDSMESSFTAPPSSAKQTVQQNASDTRQSTSHGTRQAARKSTRQNAQQSSTASVNKQKPKRQIVTPGETQVMPKITEAIPVRTDEKRTAKNKSYSSVQSGRQNSEKAKRSTSDTVPTATNPGSAQSKKAGAKASKPKKEKGEFNMAKEIRDWVIAIAIAVVLALIIRNFVFTLVRVQGESMMPTLQEGNRLYVNRFFYSPQKGDVIVFRPESDPDRPYIKRVIATEGDTLYIDFETGDVYVNGEIIDEPYINSRTSLTGSYIRELIANGQYSKDNPIVIEKDKIFVMGDNRNNSKDSRELGQIPVDELIGGAVFRFWPLSSFGSVSYEFDTSYLIEDENMNFTIVA